MLYAKVESLFVNLQHIITSNTIYKLKGKLKKNSYELKILTNDNILFIKIKIYIILNKQNCKLKFRKNKLY